MRIAVTGGRGLQGSHLAERLHGLGHYVTIMDNGSAGKNWPKCSESQIIDLTRTKPRFDSYEVIFHLAANSGGIEHNHGDQENQVSADNIVIDSNVVESAIEAGVKKFVFASSAEAIQPKGGYGSVKRSTEILLHNSGMNVSILRLFNVYGPGERYGKGAHVVPELIRKALFEDEIEVFGDGYQKRCFLYVEDAVDAYVKAFSVDYVYPIEIGNPSEIMIRDLAVKVKELSGRDIPIIFNIDKPRGPLSAEPDVRRAYDVLGWRAKTSLEVGLKQTMDWIRDDSASSLR